MQPLYLGKTNRVILNTEKTIDVVKISIVNSVGDYVKDASDNEIQDKSCTLVSGKFSYEVEFHGDTKERDVSIYWDATYTNIAVILEGKYRPEDGIIASVISTDAILVSPTYVMDNFLRGIKEDEIEATFVGYSYRDTLRLKIKSSTENLERDVQVAFTPKTIVGERFDYVDNVPIYEKFWQNTIYHTPIISIEKVEMLLNTREIIKISEAWVQIGNKKEGIIKVMPYSEGAPGLAFQMITGAGLGFAILMGAAYYVPDFFSYDYTHGLDWDTLDAHKKESIKMAIGREVAINMLPNLDTHRGLSSHSANIDGGQRNESFTSSAMYGEHSAAIKQFSDQQKKFVNQFKREYMKRLQVV